MQNTEEEPVVPEACGSESSVIHLVFSVCVFIGILMVSN